MKRIDWRKPELALALGLLIASAPVAQAAPGTFALTFSQAEEAAIRSSNRLRSADADTLAARDQADAEFATLLPRLTLDARYQYQSVVPTLTLPTPPMVPPETLTFGANSNYSIGPTLTYTVWDGGGNRHAYQGASRLMDAREADHENTSDQILLSTRLAYVKVQLAIEELRLTADSLKTSQVQNDDISKKFRAGSASEFDRLSSHREVLSYELQFRQRQADLAQSLEDLVDLTGQQSALPIGDTESPYDPSILDLEVEGVPKPTILVQFDRLTDSLGRLEGKHWPAPDESHPQLRSQRLAAEASNLAADSTDGALWPTIRLSARTSLDYPNGPILERINQNTVGVTLTMPLFEWDLTRKAADGKRAEADSARLRHDQAAIDLQRDWRKAMEQLDSLREQLAFARQSVTEAEREAKLSYDTFRLGRMSLVDVQNANFRALEAKVEAARIAAQTLLQMVDLAALSGDRTAGERKAM